MDDMGITSLALGFRSIQMKSSSIVMVTDFFTVCMRQSQLHRGELARESRVMGILWKHAISGECKQFGPGAVINDSVHEIEFAKYGMAGCAKAGTNL